MNGEIEIWIIILTIFSSVISSLVLLNTRDVTIALRRCIPRWAREKRKRHIHIHTLRHLHTCMCMYTVTHKHVHIYNTHKYTQHTYMYTDTCTQYTYVHVHSHTCTQHTHMYTHTFTANSVLPNSEIIKWRKTKKPNVHVYYIHTCMYLY